MLSATGIVPISWLDDRYLRVGESKIESCLGSRPRKKNTGRAAQQRVHLLPPCTRMNLAQGAHMAFSLVILPMAAGIVPPSWLREMSLRCGGRARESQGV